MKILQLGKFYPVLGGVEKMMFDLTVGLSEEGLSETGLSEEGFSEVGFSEVGLSEEGVECDMMCAGSDGRGTEVIRLNPHGRILCHRTLIEAAKTTIAPSMVTRLRRIAKDYDIIHIHHPDPMAAMALRLSGYKGKVVLHWHSDILSQKALLRFYLPIQNWLIKRADTIVGQLLSTLRNHLTFREYRRNAAASRSESSRSSATARGSRRSEMNIPGGGSSSRSGGLWNTRGTAI